MRNFITLKKFLFICTLLLFSYKGISQVNRAISSSSDDAEERISDGNMDLTSTDLELPYDGSNDQYIGLRFQNVIIPRGAVVTNAYVQFQVDETNSTPITLNVTGIAVDNATTFTSNDYNISQRLDGTISSSTSANVNWTLANWPTTGANGADQQTSNITTIVKEIIDRGGWNSGNAMAFVISRISGSGTRIAESYNGTHNPVLHITYTAATGREINIIGNGNNIPDGTTAISTTDDTDYGSVGIGSPISHVFTIQNFGTGNLTLFNPIITGHTSDFSVTVNPSPLTITGIGNRTFTVRFTPTITGTRSATVSIANNDSDENPYTFNIQGEGVIPAPEINITGNGVNIANGSTTTITSNDTNFGVLNVTGGTNTNTFTIENTGSIDLNLTDPSPYITITGDTADFTLTANPSTPISSSGSTTFDITFNPTSTGGKSATILIANDDSDENPYTFVVEGSGALINAGGSWSYLDDGTDHNPQLTNTAFNYATWSTGNAELGYNDGDEATVVGFGLDSNNKYPTTYFRKSYTVSADDVANSTLVMRAIRDDGIAVYVNGALVWTDNMPVTWTYLTYLTTSGLSEISGSAESTWITTQIANPFFGLPTGTYEIAIEVHQHRGNSSDLSFNFEMYTNNDYIYTPPPAPDTDGDLVADYLDADDDNDGVPDSVEGCQSSQFEDLNSGSGSEESILSDFPFSKTLDNGNQIDYSNTGTFNDITSYNAGEQGWSIRVSGPSTSGTLTMDFTNDIDDLFFKLVDFDENETWTVDVYDDTNTLIDLTAIPNIYHLGSNVAHSGNTFSDSVGGGGTNYDGDSVADDVNHSVYFFFPGISISRIVFTIEQPNGSTIRVAGMQYCVIDTDGDGIDDTVDQDSDNDGIPDLVEAGGYDTVGNGIVNILTDTDGDGLADIYDSNPSTYNTFETSIINFGDFDGDNVDNRIDLDSDNDGILDIIESGQPDTDGDGQVDGFTDTNNNNGYHDTYDGAGSILITGTDTDTDGIPNSYPNNNQDSNGFPDFIDIDADDDGITDNTEAQATGSYISFVITDTDGDGIPNVFDNTAGFGGNGLTPEDSDGDTTPDYLDTDSDDGEEPDNIEGHDTNGDGIINGSDTPSSNTGAFIGTDTDGDGLDDGFDNNTSTYDSTNGTLQATSHPIVDAGTDRDWRYTYSAIDFDGSNDYIDYGDETGYEFSGSFSLEAWILQEVSTGTRTVISKNNVSSGNERGYELSVISGVPTLKFYDSSGSTVLNISTTPNTLSTNRWHHIAATFDGTTARIYVDGIDLANGTPTASIAYGSESFLVGATYNSASPTTPSNFFNGYIDEVRVWNTVLTVNQIREMMNQEIQLSTNGAGTGIIGTVIPIDISGGLLWSSLEGYYPMTGDDADDDSSYSKDGNAKNITSLMPQTAPLPYTTKADGDWTDTSGTTPWTLGDTVWDYPNSTGIDGTPIDWNIVVTSHNVEIDDDTTVLGLLVDANELQINGTTNMATGTGTGNALNVTNYLKIDGVLDLEGESQLLQPNNSVYDNTSVGRLERDQQGTQDFYTYNYWSSPVRFSNASTSYTLSQVFNDGTTPIATPSTPPASITYLTSGYNGTTSPLSIADYWIWKYNNRATDDYSQWQHVRSTGSLEIGEGFTMKGVANSGSSFTSFQNYVYSGKPNNGDITLPISAGSDYLIGNPYPSAIDADEFILDNTNDGLGRAISNIIDGTLYFWEHFASNTHYLGEYEGGYGMYTLMGSTAAITSDLLINTSGSLVSTKGAPGQHIPIGLGFFVVADDPNPSGNIITFKNSQRVFVKETASSSTFIKQTNSKASNTATSIDERLKIRLMFDSPKGYHRQLLVGVDPNATNGVDIGYDAKLIEDNTEDLFWDLNNLEYIIQAVNNFDVDQTLPLGVKISQEGIATIKIDELENIETSQNIFLHDKTLNIYHDLQQSNYEVFLAVGEHLNRFEIVFSSPNSLDIENLNQSILEIYYSNESDKIIIHNPNSKFIKSVQLFNVLGQSIFKQNTGNNDDYIEYKSTQLNSGAYILKAETEGGTVTKKVLIK